MTDEALARRLAGAMERKYTKLTDGLRPQELPGVGNRTVARTGEIFLEAGEAPAFKLGYRVEELHHYFQLRSRGWLGRESLTGAERKLLEDQLAARMRRWGFKPYDYREYQPYTNVPRPKGVVGDE